MNFRMLCRPTIFVNTENDRWTNRLMSRMCSTNPYDSFVRNISPSDECPVSMVTKGPTGPWNSVPLNVKQLKGIKYKTLVINCEVFFFFFLNLHPCSPGKGQIVVLLLKSVTVVILQVYFVSKFIYYCEIVRQSYKSELAITQKKFACTMRKCWKNLRFCAKSCMSLNTRTF